MIADYDDLIFTEPQSYPSLRSGSSSLWSVRRQMGKALAALRAADRVTVSTEPLAEAVRSLHPSADVAVVPNGLSHQWLRQGDALSAPWRPGMPRVIRYLPGSRFHDRDFAVALPALAAFLAEQPAIRLEIVGPLRVDGRLLPTDRVTYRSPVPFEHLPGLLASAWTSIAPLEDTEFTRCKSAIKYLESAAFSCPCIASPIPDMVRCQAGGVLLARGTDEWLQHLRALCDDEFRNSIASVGRAWVRREGTAIQTSRAFSQAVLRWIRPHAD